MKKKKKKGKNRNKNQKPYKLRSEEQSRTQRKFKNPKTFVFGSVNTPLRRA